MNQYPGLFRPRGSDRFIDQLSAVGYQTTHDRVALVKGFREAHEQVGGIMAEITHPSNGRHLVRLLSGEEMSARARARIERAASLLHTLVKQGEVITPADFGALAFFANMLETALTSGALLGIKEPRDLASLTIAVNAAAKAIDRNPEYAGGFDPEKAEHLLMSVRDAALHQLEHMEGDIQAEDDRAYEERLSIERELPVDPRLPEKEMLAEFADEADAAAEGVFDSVRIAAALLRQQRGVAPPGALGALGNVYQTLEHHSDLVLGFLEGPGMTQPPHNLDELFSDERWKTFLEKRLPGSATWQYDKTTATSIDEAAMIAHSKLAPDSEEAKAIVRAVSLLSVLRQPDALERILLAEADFSVCKEATLDTEPVPLDRIPEAHKNRYAELAQVEKSCRRSLDRIQQVRGELQDGYAEILETIKKKKNYFYFVKGILLTSAMLRAKKVGVYEPLPKNWEHVPGDPRERGFDFLDPTNDNPQTGPTSFHFVPQWVGFLRFVASYEGLLRLEEEGGGVEE